MKAVTIAWFEIPVNDMKRATSFYEAVFETTLTPQNFGDVLMAFFPGQDSKNGAPGSLMKYESYVPSEEGSLVYFSCEDVQNELNRVASAGGIIRQEKTQISPEHGYMAVVIDTEGNRIALHSTI